ncbi:MAG: acyl-ACP--UDP-N-acetylglucosamine O-acyltransferase [Elusimicrobiales bacterium]
MKADIHSSAVIHPSAKIADGARIGPFVVIGEDVTVGEGTYIGPHCLVEFAEIGKNNRMEGGAYIGLPAQDFGYYKTGGKTKIVIGDNNIIREGVSLHRASSPELLTKIGSNCMFMANSHVGHDGIVGDGVVIVNGSALAGHCEVEDNALISAFVGVHQFARIGRLAMATGGAKVALDLPPFCRAQGDRAKLVGLNLVGMRRAGIARENISSVKQAYKTLFFSGMRLEEALAKLKETRLTPEAAHFVAFCEKSKRGVMRPRMRALKVLETESDE